MAGSTSSGFLGVLFFPLITSVQGDQAGHQGNKPLFSKLLSFRKEEYNSGINIQGKIGKTGMGKIFLKI